MNLFFAFVTFGVATGIFLGLGFLLRRLILPKDYFPHGDLIAIPIGWFAWSVVMRATWSLGLLIPHPLFVFALTTGLITLTCLWAKIRLNVRATLHESDFRTLLSGVIIFLTGMAFWCVVRSTQPGIFGQEKPMDTMLLNAAMRSGGPLVEDPWLAGEVISYYFGGHLTMGQLALLCNWPLELAVNLGQAFWFALCVNLAVYIPSLLAPRWTRNINPSLQLVGSGILGVIFLLLISSPAGALEARDFLAEKANAPDEQHLNFWWWDATRALHDQGDAGQKVDLITEFPFFSFWLGDNHAHLLHIPFFLLAIGFAAGLARCRTIPLIAFALPFVFVAQAWVSNRWDTPAVLALFFLGWVTHLLQSKESSITLPPHNYLLSVLAVGFALMVLIVLPQQLSVSAPDVGLASTDGQSSSLLDIVKIFGFFIPACLILLGVREKTNWFSLSLFLLCICMLLACNFFRIDDVFQNRMNTVFKVYYQIWLMLALLTAAVLGSLLAGRNSARLIACALILPMGWGLLYPVMMLRDSFQGKEAVKGLSIFDAPDSAATRDLVIAARDLIAPGEVIAEAEGESYNAYSAILGVWTRGSNVLGWSGHQSQWRSPDDFLPAFQIRTERLRRIYEAQDENALFLALHTSEYEGESEALDVDWVLLGPTERAAYQQAEFWKLWMSKFGHRVYSDHNFILWRVD